MLKILPVINMRLSLYKIASLWGSLLDLEFECMLIEKYYTLSIHVCIIYIMHTSSINNC
jgi:hypothetical protein